MRTTLKIALSFLAGTAILGSAAEAQVTQRGNGYLFRQKFTPGQTLRYTFRVNTIGAMPGSNKPMTLVMPMAMKVVSVRAGIATMSITRGAMSMNGQRMGANTSPPVTIKMNNQGKVVQGPAGSSGSLAVLPANPVPVGGTWTSTVPIPQMGQAKATYKFLGISNVGGRPVARIGMSMSSLGATRMSGTGTTLISVADGSAVSANMNMNLTMPAARQGTKPQTMKMRINISRS